MKTKAIHPVARRELDAIRDADYFLVTRRIGVGRYQKRRAATLEAAKAMGTGDRKQLIYVVTKAGVDWPLFVI